MGTWGKSIPDRRTANPEDLSKGGPTMFVGQKRPTAGVERERERRRRGSQRGRVKREWIM